MRWELRRRLWLTVLGACIVGLAITVMIVNQSLSTELLGAIGVLAGFAMILTALPSNGNEKGGVND
jgi:hypothetical protein